MILRFLAASIAIAVVLGFVGETSAQEKKASAKDETTPPKAQSEGKPTGDAEKAGEGEAKIEKATFGGGCFWSIEAIFERIPGVKSVVSGFAGGNVPNPSYEMVGTGQTGHAECVQIEYDPTVVTYEKLLKVFWSAHDPTTLNSQGDDFGPQYRSIILYHNDAQKQAALKSYKELTARRAYRHPIVTELVPFTAFFPAEPYHQDYYRNHRYSEYSQIYIIPKLKKLKLNK
jgi:peptide-methionine (S)-S-oxide reductase